MGGRLTRIYKSQSFIKFAGRVHFQYLEGNRQLRLVRLMQEVLDKLRSDALILLFWSDLYGRQENPIAGATSGDVSNRLTIPLDDQE